MKVIYKSLEMGSANGDGSFLVNGICFFDEHHGMTAITDHEALSFYQTSDGGKNMFFMLDRTVMRRCQVFFTNM